MPLQIQSVSIQPNPVGAGGNYTLSVQIKEITQNYIPWYSSQGMLLADISGNELGVFNSTAGQSGYTSRWPANTINRALSAWTALTN